MRMGEGGGQARLSGTLPKRKTLKTLSEKKMKGGEIEPFQGETK